MDPYTNPPCPVCGTWECLDCGTKASRRNRYFPGQHHCRTCRSTNGRMLPTRHREDIHDLHEADVDPQATCHYPLDDSQPLLHSKENPVTSQRPAASDPEVFVASHIEAAAKAIALLDGWTELNWNMIPARSRKYYEMAQAGLAAAHPMLVAVMKKQQATLDAVAKLADDFASKPRNAMDTIEQPGFGRGVRAAGREIRALLDDSL